MASKIYLRKSIDKSVRDELEKHYHPKGSFEWRFLVWLLHATTKEQSFNPVQVSPAMVAAMANKEKQYLAKNFSAHKVVDKFSQEVIHLAIEKVRTRKNNLIGVEHNFNEVVPKFPTEIWITERPAWPKEVLSALEDVRAGTRTKSVWIVTGVAFTRKHKAKATQELKDDLLRVLDKNKSVVGTKILNYMNNLTTWKFTNQLKYMPQARETAQKVKDSKNQLDMLEFIENEITQPLYKQVEKSTRIYAIRQNIAGLERSVRKVLTQGWIEGDLKSAQLAVVARRWNVTKLQKFLKTGASFWTYLMDYMKLADKDFLKQMTYAVVFGASKGRERPGQEIKGLLGVAEKYDYSVVEVNRFLDIPLIKTLWRKRRVELRKIKNEGGAFDCFGSWIELKPREGRSVLAQVAQSYELALLEPVVDWFIKNGYKNKYGALMVLWQHDGFSFTTRPSFEPWVTKALGNLVKERALKLGVVSYLEIEKNEVKVEPTENQPRTPRPSIEPMNHKENCNVYLLSRSFEASNLPKPEVSHFLEMKKSLGSHYATAYLES